MDVHEIWQENKRWILGVAIGAVVFFIAHTVIGSTFDSRRVEMQARRMASGVAGEPKFDQKARDALQEESETLIALERDLIQAVRFVPRPEFDLHGKGSFHLHFDEVSRAARARMLAGAERAGVDLAAKDIVWPTPATEDEAQSVLLALDLLDDALARMYAASEEVRAAAPDAHGLVAVDELRIEGDKKAARGRRRAAADANERIKEYRVNFKLRADAPTVIAFLERFKHGDRPINLGSNPPLSIRADGKRPGQPLLVSGSLVAMFVEPVREDA